jgi:molybdate/tungstate transport system substrate-binding protein
MLRRPFISRMLPLVGSFALVGGLWTALASAPVSAAPSGSGPVSVLYAGSLVTVMQKSLAPAFQKATGYTVNGVSGGSKDLAADIKAGTQQADVFISAAPAVNATLSGSANGNWVSWYAAFGTSPLLLAYNPDSSFAQQLKTKPWYKVVGQPGFLLGRTDPATDPKGVLAVQALNAAATKYHQPSLATIAASTGGEYPEQTLVGELQAGQLDAGFFYGVEASAANLKTLPLTGVAALSATYTVTVVNRAPDATAARAFTAFLLGKQGRTILAANGIKPISPPKVKGKVPGTVKGAVPG